MEPKMPGFGDFSPVSYQLPDPLDLRVQVTEETDLRSLTPAQLYELNQNYLDDTVPSSQPPISELAPLSTLRTEYEGSSGSFIKQIDFLIQQGYEGIRRSRGDGDCFYRSLIFAYIERIFSQEDRKVAVDSSVSTLQDFLPRLREVGFKDMVVDESYEIPRDLIRGIIDPEPVSMSTNGTTLTPAHLLREFQDESTSKYLVTFMRMITSTQIQGEPETYEPFLTHPDTGETMGVKDFCRIVVEVLGKEADHVQLTALSQALKVNLKIAYLDGRSQDGRVEFVSFNYASDGKETPLTLIYRPGHYDILDRRSSEPLPINPSP
ncbi:cysteine proteinase [Russula ochroleuca]|jgi:ubiquitin thioesterase protein OTUB1|uniref:ubiquitinyl hydrolase 1 n=1 Tax=Russula ochroleuca TaxID=152965 RepID=A0A9P5N602_9AGAM|nr:cysteine proteinase [Russula ochroleuca]